MNYNYQQDKSNLLYAFDKRLILSEMSKKLLSDLLLVRRILLLSINKRSYDIYRKNQDQLIMILALLSIKDEELNIENFNIEVTTRMSIIKKYFNVNNPNISKNTVYFKPNFKKIEMLIKNFNY
ncbi:hypothetical protein [Clostridium sp. HMP27]|nr:hypothetical protein [Clostridium sp. HMP27]KGK88584.1 hypothetical protein DP68_06955 [Clostridium sp. HMP27]